MAIFIANLFIRSKVMKNPKVNSGRGPMIHIRLEEDVHRELKMMAAEKRTTIQKLVSDLIQRTVLRGKK